MAAIFPHCRVALVLLLCSMVIVPFGIVKSTTAAGGAQKGTEDAAKPTEQKKEASNPTEPENAAGQEPSGGEKRDERVDWVRLGTVHQLQLARRATASDEEAKEIKQLIAKLATIDSPDYGLSGSLSGDAFLPIVGKSQFSMGLLTDHRLKSSPELKKLVEFGPRALPFLLAALEDKTATKLTMTHGGGFGGMYHENEMWGNPVNPTESRILAGKKQDKKTEHIDSYTIKVGDVCYVAIGQIVGRSYSAVRYQPTAIIVLNSPTHDEQLRKMAREIWASDNAGQKLLDALLLDYATEGVFNGRSLDGWGLGDYLQRGAAMRLLYYFPKETAGIIAERIDKLDLSATTRYKDGSDSSMKQCVANGVRADEFLEAINWCEEEPIQAALLRAFERAGDVDVVLAAAPAAARADVKKVHERLAAMLKRLPDPKDGDGPYGEDYELLEALARYAGNEAKPVFKDFLTSLSATRRHTICLVLREVRSEWSIELLESSLKDKRKAGGWTYSVDPMANEPRRPMRICDEAALTIAGANKHLQFEYRGDHDRLDLQIQIMQAAIEEARKQAIK